MNLDGLPAVQFVDYDAAKVESAIIGDYETIAQRTLAPGDPVRLFLESLAYEISLLRYQIDWSAKQNLLAYASGEYLDALGALVGVERLGASAAQTTLEFTLSGALDFSVIIPAGTQATPDNSIYFATDYAIIIVAGLTSGQVTATCQTVGTAGNGFVAGQIDNLVDPIAYVESATNITVSLGGTETELDDRLRGRVQAAAETFAVAGPELAYVERAKAARSDIIDVSAYSPSPGQVYVHPLMEGGELPDQDALDDVTAELTDKKRRPLTDNVTVSAPAAVSYDLELTYYIETGSAALAASIQEAVTEAVGKYKDWQSDAIGRDIDPGYLIALVRSVAGLKRVAVTSPAEAVTLDRDEVAQLDSESIVYGGLEEA